MLFNEGNHNTETDVTVQYKMPCKLKQLKLSENATRKFISKPCFAVDGKVDIYLHLDRMASQSAHTTLMAVIGALHFDSPQVQQNFHLFLHEVTSYINHVQGSDNLT